MSAEPVFSRRLLIGWIAGAVAVFALSLYLMGAGEMSGIDSTGPGTFSRSAIGHAGIAEVLQRLGFPVVKSQYNSLEKLSPGSVLVIAEPRPGRQSEEAIRTLLKAGTDSAGAAEMERPAKRADGGLASPGRRALHRRRAMDPQSCGPACRGGARRGWSTGSSNSWSTNEFGLAPNLGAAHATDARGRAAADHRQRPWHAPRLRSATAIARSGFFRTPTSYPITVLPVRTMQRWRWLCSSGCALATEASCSTKRCTAISHEPASPFMLMFRFPFVVATIQGLIAIVLLLWATLERFGAPQSAPPPLRAGREGLLQNMAKLIEYRRSSAGDDTPLRPGNHPRRRAPAARAARDSRARRSLPGCNGWERRAEWRWIAAHSFAELGELDEARRREPPSLVRLARDIHKWKGQILDGRSRHPRDR